MTYLLIDFSKEMKHKDILCFLIESPKDMKFEDIHELAKALKTLVDYLCFTLLVATTNSQGNLF